MNNIKLLKGLKNYSTIEFKHKVKLVTSYLDEVIVNSVFICFNKNEVNLAINKGAKTIIYEDKIVKDNPIVNYVLVDDIKKAKAILYKKFYSKKLKDIKIIGVIGTTGKSTTSRLICDYLNYKNCKTLWIGTHEILYKNESYKTDNTTIDISLLYKHLVLASKRNYKYLVMEVSSIGVSELRVYGIEFYRLVFTNFSEDHLDYHKNMDEYFYSKAIVFYQTKNTVILNKDDGYFNKINKYINSNYLTYSINNVSDVYASDVFHNNSKLHFRIEDEVYGTRFFGNFFVYNILAFLTTIKSLGFKIEDSKEFLSNYNPIKGRMNRFTLRTNKIIVDYAHTPKSLEVVLKFLRKYTSNKLIVVGGCGGNREKEKRIIMGDLISEYADYAILCDDNPRNEKSLDILNDINQNHEFEILPNRKEAILKGISMLDEYDTLLIFGKGDEDGIIYNDIIVPHNDIEVVIDELLVVGK